MLGVGQPVLIRGLTRSGECRRYTVVTAGQGGSECAITVPSAAMNATTIGTTHFDRSVSVGGRTPLHLS